MRSRASLVVVLLLSVAFLLPHRVLAESGTTLTQVRLIAEGPTQTILDLAFTPKASTFSVVTGDPLKPGLNLPSVSRSQGAVSPPNMRGIVRGVEFDQAASGLVVRFQTVVPSKVTASPSGQNKILVTISRSVGGEGPGPGTPGTPEPTEPAGFGPASLPQAVDPVPGEDGYELVMLKYADVSEIVGLLTEGITVKSNNIFIRREPGFGSPGTSGGNYTASANPSAYDDKPLGQSVDSSLAIDRRLNAVWIKGSPERIARLKAQIALIDVPVDSVILETQFVELTEAGARNIGVDFNNANGQLAVGTVQAGQFIPFGFGTDRLDSAALQAAIYAQIQNGEGRIVSKPRIAAQSGSTAKIITGDALPILTAITLSGVNGVSQQVQYVNVGVTLQIAPRVSPDGFVTSNIYGVVSSVTGFSQGYPTISQREAETSASVKDGETFVIGGLTQENEISTDFKVPILGDIPLLGELFSLEKTTKAKTELYIVITPHIVRHRRFETAIPSPSAAAQNGLPLADPPIVLRNNAALPESQQ